MKSITINGKTYHPGDEIEVEVDGTKQRLPFPTAPEARAAGELSDDDLDAVTGGAGGDSGWPCAFPPGAALCPNRWVCDVVPEFLGFICFGNSTSGYICYGSSTGHALDRIVKCQGAGGEGTMSDGRVKSDIQPLQGALNTLLSLHGVTFEYDAPEALGTRPGQHVGFVAQEVEQVLPTWVREEGGIKRLKAEGLSFEALAVEAIRELTKKNEELAEANAALAARLDRIESGEG